MSARSAVGKLWDREPVLVLALLQGALAMGVTFGLNLTADQVGGIMIFAAAVVGFIARQNVYSPATVERLGSDESIAALEAD
jgi:formate hydrogenlyase subunit 3/multisubunit Na+/H+ antiporter MnhD subunit